MGILTSFIIQGLIYFNLYRCSDVVAAFNAAKEIVEAHIKDPEEWTEEFLSSAKSSLIFEYIGKLFFKRFKNVLILMPLLNVFCHYRRRKDAASLGLHLPLPLLPQVPRRILKVRFTLTCF